MTVLSTIVAVLLLIAPPSLPLRGTGVAAPAVPRLADNESQYGVNDGGIGREWRMGGPVWDGKGQWLDQSPFRYAGKWKTPALITQGELDFRVPLNESITTFKLLQRQGVRARLLTFPDEGHWILKGENSRRHLAEILGWLQAHLK